MRKPKVLFVLGGPGSGKGTQCDNIVKQYGFKHLSAGELLREEVKRGTSLGEEINGYVSKGEMVPGLTTVKLIRQAMEERGWDKHIFIIDGYPRNFSNIDYWKTHIKDDVEIVGVLYLSCPEEVMKQRIMKRGETSGRSDDNEETFKTRIRVYLEETTPVIEHYKKEDKVFEASAEGTIEECFAECKKIIEGLNLDKAEELNEVRAYLHENVDPYIKPLISYLMKNKPKKVHSAIKYWIDNDGDEIRKKVEKE